MEPKTINKEHSENILEHLKPSEALEYMLAGMERFKDDERFIIDPSTYGEFTTSPDDTIRCYGCMATCAIFAITGEEPTMDNISMFDHPVNGYTRNSVRRFEEAIDYFRSGKLHNFLWYWKYHSNLKLDLDGVTEELKLHLYEEGIDTAIFDEVMYDLDYISDPDEVQTYEEVFDNFVANTKPVIEYLKSINL